jgi:hypothetical protein
MENKALVAKGSIQDMAKTGDTALTILDAKVVLICDRSGSMANSDAVGGKTRAEVEDQIVEDLQKKYPGQIILEAFAESAILCTNGVLPYPDGAGTILSTALQLASSLTTLGMKAILLTDGEARDDERDILKAAEPLRGKLDIVFIGPDLSPGRSVLNKLAKYTSGTFHHNDLKGDPKFLERQVETLMLKAG